MTKSLKYISGFAVLTIALTFSVVVPVSAQQAQRPNIVLILVDDLGFSDTGPYGATEIETPNLNQLASQGLRLKEFYNNSICAPTRASSSAHRSVFKRSGHRFAWRKRVKIRIWSSVLIQSEPMTAQAGDPVCPASMSLRFNR